MKIVKRDGQIVNYNRDKIIIAISKANKEVNEDHRVSKEQIEEIVCYIESLDKKRMLVEDIQDIIENKLMEYGKYELAKKYIVYRYTRALVRRKNVMDESILGLIKKTDETMEDNPNKNGVLASSQRDLIAGEVSKELTKRILLPTKIVKAHDDGEIYFHDSEYFLQSIFNCSYLDLANMLENGTVINNKAIETPKTFLVACLVTSQIIISTASNQYGGVSIDIADLAKYLRKTKERLKSELTLIQGLDELTKEKIVNSRYKYELSSGIQLFQYQLNTLMTTNGQYPDVTLFLNTGASGEYESENIEIIEEILIQRAQGIKDKDSIYVFPRFPKLVYLLDEDNVDINSKYYYITKMALECSKRGEYPHYVSAKMMRRYYKNNVFSPLGDHYFLPVYQDDDKYKFKGRFNQGIVTLNLVQIALLANENETSFYKLLEDRLELAKEALMCKYYALLSTNSDISPLHYIYGGISRLNEGEVIDRLLNEGYSTLALSFIGLYEAVKLLHNDTLTDHELALKIIRKIKTTLDRYKQSTGIGFCLYAGEDYTTSYYLANKDRKQFGNIKGITDKGYYCANYKVDGKSSDYKERLLKEKDFDLYCNGGSCHTINIEILNKERETDELIKFIYDNLLYTEFREELDECKVCGYKGRMLTSAKHTCECPNCHNRDKTKFNIYKKLYE